MMINTGRWEEGRQSDVRRRRSLSTVHRHPERKRRISVHEVSEGKVVNTGEQEGGRLFAVRFLPASHSHPEPQAKDLGKNSK